VGVWWEGFLEKVSFEYRCMGYAAKALTSMANWSGGMCLPAAPWVQLSVRRAMDSRIMHCGIIH